MDKSKFLELGHILIIWVAPITGLIFQSIVRSLDEWTEKTTIEPLLDSIVDETNQASVVTTPLTCPIDEHTENEYFKQLSNPYIKN